MKRFITVVLASLMLLSIASCGKKEEGTVPYTLIISCDEILSNMDSETFGIKEEKKAIVPKDGKILEITAKCGEGVNAFDLVVENLKAKKLHFEGVDGYFNGIANIYAGDCGQFSGWLFFINGNLAELGASDTVGSSNDIIEFRFIVDYNSLF